MRKFLLILLLLCASTSVLAADINVILEKAPIDRSDMESVKRGAQFFAANCISCHTMIYLRYNKLANDAGVTYARMPVNVTNWPSGIKPPDLTLETNVRGVDWVYTYLHSFYVDPTRPTGANNLIFPNVMMPNMLGMYQGQQAVSSDLKQSETIYQYAFLGDVHWYDVLVLKTKGSMSSTQFDATIADVVNFLAYAAEPYREQQRQIGWWVIGSLLILFVLVYLLKQEYWKDVK